MRQKIIFDEEDKNIINSFADFVDNYCNTCGCDHCTFEHCMSNLMDDLRAEMNSEEDDY